MVETLTKTSPNSATTPVVAISEKGSTPADPERARPILTRKYAPLMNLLIQRGLQAVVLNGREDYDLETQLFNRYFELVNETDGPRLRQVDQSIMVDAARDLTGGIARYTNVPALNPEGIRNISYSKKAQYEALKASGVDGLAESHFLEEDDISGILDALHALEGDMAVIKPEKGVHSQGVIIGTKAELAMRVGTYLSERERNRDLIVVQEYLPDVASAFPAMMRPLSDRDGKLMNGSGVKEIRVHVIDEEPILVHGRIGEDSSQTQAGGDEFIFFDQLTIPDGVIKRSIEAARALRHATGDKDSYLAVDLTPTGSHVIEVNGRNPAPITRNDKATDNSPHTQWAEGLAQKLDSMARRKRRTA